MNLFKKLVIFSCFAVLAAANLMASPNGTKKIVVEFTLDSIVPVFGEQALFSGTYVTLEDDVEIDTGRFTDLGKALGNDNNNCNGKEFNNYQTISLYGLNGTAIFTLVGRTAKGCKNILSFNSGSGVYSDLSESQNVTIIADCTAPENQYILKAKVKTVQ